MRAPRRLAVVIPLLMAVVAAGCSSNVPIEAVSAAPTSVGATAPVVTNDAPTGDVEIAADPAPTVVPERSSEQQSASEQPGGEVESIRDIDFNNGFEYPGLVEWSNEMVTVTDGMFENGEFGDEDYFWFGVSDVHVGDLDGDGVEDAVVSTTWNGGGTGWFDAMSAYRLIDGTAEQIGIVHFGDRADGGIFASEIDNGVVRVWAFSGGQGACCPSQIAESRLLLGGHSLVQADTLPSQAWISLDAYGDADVVDAVSFLQGTSSAMVAIYGDLDAAVFSVEASQGQVLRVETTSGPTPSTVTLTNTASGTAQVLGGTVTLPADAIYEVSLEFDESDRSDRTILDVSIDPLTQAPSVGWTSVVEQTVVTAEPDVFSSVVWPVFTSDQPGTEGANEELAAYARALDDLWIKDATNESGLGADPLDDSTYDAYYTVTLVTDEVVSVRFNYYDYVCCRPYPNYGQRSMVLDLVAGRQLLYDEIIDVGRLDEIIETWIREHVAQNQGDAQEFERILANNPAFDSLSLVPGGIEFGTDRNGFGGGSIGTQTVVTFEQLGDLMNPDLVARLSEG